MPPKQNNPVELRLHEQTLVLYPEKAIYWKEESILLLADLHLGKSQHFRRNGIPVPVEVQQTQLKRLEQIINRTDAKEVMVIGDLFHSVHNVQWEVFAEFIRGFADLRFTLVPGNHDILDQSDYARAGIEVLPLIYDRGPFMFVHERIDEVPEGYFSFSGHEHPGVKLKGKGRQSLVLPCFYFGESVGLLPAFGSFTGLSRIMPEEGSMVYAIAENTIYQLNTTSSASSR